MSERADGDSEINMNQKSKRKNYEQEAYYSDLPDVRNDRMR